MVEKGDAPTPPIENSGNGKMPRQLKNVQRLNIDGEEHQKI